VRATRQAILAALLEPRDHLFALEADGRGAQKLAWMEAARTLPFGAVWDMLCLRADVPIGLDWIAAVETYERRVQNLRCVHWAEVASARIGIPTACRTTGC